MTKEKSRAEATANSINQQQYNRARQKMQDGTHHARLLDYLWINGQITSFECFEKLHNTRISATVYKLRHIYGVPVNTDYITKNGYTFGVYSIERSNQNV